MSHRAASFIALLLAARPAFGGEAAAEPVAPSASAYAFAPLHSARLVVRDEGLDVTSAAYAGRRRFVRPLRLVSHDLSREDWARTPVPHGTVAIDPARGRLKFCKGYAGPVELVRRVRLPHGSPHAVALRGRYLFYSTGVGAAGLHVADVADPTRPRLVAFGQRQFAAFDAPEGLGRFSMAMSGDAVYAAAAGLVSAWDVSDPLHPKELPPVRGGALAIAAHAGTLYFTRKHSNELGVVDVARPAATRRLEPIRFEPRAAVGPPRFLAKLMFVPGALAPPRRAAPRSSWPTVRLSLREDVGPEPKPRLLPVVYVLDATAPHRPEPRVRWTGARLAGVATIRGRRVVVLRGAKGGLAFVDAADVRAPRLIAASRRLEGSFVIDGTRLYLARTNPWREGGGFFVYDIADLTAPRLLGKLTAPDRRFSEERSVWKLHLVRGGYAYLTDYFYGVLIVDVRDPSHPRIASGLHEAGEAFCLAVTDERVFVGENMGGLTILDGRVPARTRRVGNFQVGAAWGVAARGSLAFVANLEGLRIVDTSDPARPVELAMKRGVANALAVRLRGSLAFVVGNAGTGEIVDIRDPRAPLRRARFATRKAFAIDVAGDTLYVADLEEGLVIFDVRDPRRPRRVGVLPRKDGFTGVCVRGRQAFLATRGGLVVADVADPRQPRVLVESTEGRGGLVVGDYIYTAAYFGDHDLLVTDISDLAHPKIVARYRSGRYPYGTDVAFHRGLVYLASLPHLAILRAMASGQAPRGRVTVAPAGAP